MLLQPRTLPNGLIVYVAPVLEKAGIAHAFTTRVGGVSRGPYAQLNLGPACDSFLTDSGDSAENIRINYQRLETIFNLESLRRVWVSQVHGQKVLDAVLSTEGIPTQALGEADALVTAQPGVALTIRVADCVPILLADLPHRAVAAIHAGWRGLVGGIVPQTLLHLAQHHDIHPVELVAAIGPAITKPHFEVGPEVAAAFHQAGLQAHVHTDMGPKPHIDLPAAARSQLLAAGVMPQRIDTTDRCTFRDETEFFSHRRDQGLTGRMAAMIALNRVSLSAQDCDLDSCSKAVPSDSAQ